MVKDEQGNPLYCNDGTERLGRGLALTTFRKQYHALRTLHVHFQQDNISKVRGRSLEAGFPPKKLESV